MDLRERGSSSVEVRKLHLQCLHAAPRLSCTQHFFLMSLDSSLKLRSLGSIKVAADDFAFNADVPT